jgi:hypothetical protein
MPKIEKDADEPTTAQVLDKLTQILAGNQEVQKAQLKQTAPKRNTSPPNISVYNPRGQKDFAMPTLKCELYAPFQLTPSLQESSPSLDREEVELFNLLEPGIYTLMLADDSEIPVSVIGTRNALTGALERIGLMGAKDPDTNGYTALFTHSNKQTFPPFKKMLRQLVGARGDAVMPMAEELRRTQLPVEHPDHFAVSLGE